MPVHEIFNCIDIIREIASYLSFENKFLVNKIFNTNCFISCNFTGKKFRCQCIGYITRVTDFSIINTNDVKQAAKIIAGTARQMGVEIKD